MTNSVRKSLDKKIIFVLIAALLVLVLSFQVVYAPGVVFAPNHSTNDAASADTMNGVSVTYTQADNGLAGPDFDYSLTDSSVYSASSNRATPAPSKSVEVIVSLEGTPMIEYATDGGMSVAEALATTGGKKNLENLKYIRECAYNEISKYVTERRYDYSTVMNAFSATVRYGDIAAIESSKYVKNVILSKTYLAPEAVTENYVDVYETGIFNSEGVGYDGTGTVVAVLDTGTDYTHEVFNMELNADTLAMSKDDVKAVASALSATSQSRIKGETINEDDLYLTSKLPYAYDYADSDTNVYPNSEHGTHVAGIIAGKSKKITGVAPGAQIATFKVFSDFTSGAKTEWIMAALEDAVILGVDAINMSLGSSSGFSREVDEEIINRVYDSVNAHGICLVCAASNDGSSAQGSTWGNTNLASNPDSGTVGSPGSYNAALSVASVSGVKTKYFMYNGKEIYFSESRLVGKTEQNDFVGGMLGDKTEDEFEYVVVPGIGLPVNYADLDVTGKIAVVKRGTNNFEDKVRIAAGRGAIGVIVYNNVSGTIGMSVGTKEIIPSCFITMDLAEDIVAAGRGKIKLSTSYLAGPFMSDFSSWGCLPNLILAPDITAHGGEIYSSIPGGDQYDKLSGTSMACPNLAGALILVREFVKQKERNASTVEVRDESYSRMMSTATIVKNEQGNPYSPRKQGAGIADISHSINTKAYLTVDGLNKPKLSLGDDPKRTGVYELKFNLVNDSSSAVGYSLDQYVMTESLSTDDRTVSEKAHVFTDTTNTYSIKVKNGSAKLNGNAISVSGYGEVEITVKIALSDADKDYLDDLFVNGMFVEGYVMLKSQNTDGIDLNIPYMAFYGNWADAPMLDVTAYEVGESEVDDSVLEEDKLKPDVYATLPYSGFYSAWGADNMGYYGMGAFAYNIASGYKTPATQEKFASLTSNSDGDYMLYMISAGLLRGAKRVDMEIRDSVTGELIWSGVDYNARKSHASGGTQTGGFVLVELDIRTLDLPNNSKYTFSMTCYLDWKGDNSYITDYSDQIDNMDDYVYGNKNTFSFEFTIDNEAPMIADASVRKVLQSNGTYRHYLELSLHDNNYMQGFGVYTYGGTEIISGYERLTDVTSIKDGLIPVDGEFNSNTLCSVDISGYWNKIMENDGKLYITLYDYAKNTSSFYLVINEEGDSAANPDADLVVSPNSDLTITKNRNVRDNYTVKVNEQLDFSTFLTVRANINGAYQEGYWMKDLIWKIDDPTVADITNEGVLTGLKEGKTTLIVHTPNVSGYNEKDPEHSLKFTINVKGEQAGGLKVSGVELSATSLNLERGETAVITAKIKPYSYKGNVKLSWSTTNADIVSYSVNDKGGMSVEIKAQKSGSATIQANVEDSYISGYCSVTVLREFNVTDNIYLRSYTGRGGDWVNEKGEVEHNVVEIPDDLGIVYIYPNAFYGNEYIEKVIIPEGVMTIMRATFFNCSNLREVVLPKTLTSIEYLAFANCNKLEKINLGNVHTIGDSAFWGCAMEELDLSKCTYIDKYAFVYNSKLKSLDLSRVGMIGGGAFAHCLGLETLVIPENTSMGYDTLYLDSDGYSINRGGAFAFCTGLKSVVIKSSTVGESAFFACFALESVVFENDVELIDVNAFAHCYALESVKFFGSVYKIDTFAFLRCTELREITLPDGLSVLGSNVFYGCDRLSVVKISSGALLDSVSVGSLGGLEVEEFIVENGNKYLSSEDGVLYDRAKKKLIAYPSAKVTSDYSFTVPDSVKTIGEAAFSGVRLLFNIDLRNVEYIEANAFRDVMFVYPVDNRIRYVTFNNCNNIKYIGDAAFYGAVLNNIPISTNNTTHIGTAAFFAVQLSSDNANSVLTIPKNLQYLGALAFSGAQATYTDGSKGLISMGFTTVTFSGSSIKNVGVGAFALNPSITTVNLGNLESISASMFEGCAFTSTNSNGTETTKGIKSITIPVTVKSIGENAFNGCSELTSVTFVSSVVLPNNEIITSQLSKIADGAFAGTGITSINLLDTITEIGDGAFENSKLKSITLPAATTSIGAKAFASTPLTEVKYKSGNGAVKVIGDEAFSDCAYLTSVSFPSAISVGNGAFKGCKALTSVNLSSATAICDQAFSDCEALKTISLAKAESIGARAFSGAKQLATVTIPKAKSIGAEAFSETAVTAINLSKDFANAAEKAFYGAEKLASITVEQGNGKYVSMNGVLYSKNASDFYTLVSYPAGKTDKKEYSVYDRTVKLSAYSFNGNKTLTQVTLPVYLKVIGISAMSGMDNLVKLYINAVDAPVLESYATMEYPEKDEDDDVFGDSSAGDDKVGDSDVENDNELQERNDGVFTNHYDNFNFAFEDADKEQKLKIYIPYNNNGYNGLIWNKYVGKCLTVSDKLHVTLATLELIDNIKAEIEKTTHDSANITNLMRIYNLTSESQKQFILGNYDYQVKDGDDKVVATIDKNYYKNMLGARNYYSELSALRGKASSSSASDNAKYSIMSVDVDSSIVIYSTVVAVLCLVIATAITTFVAKRRNRK